MSVAEILKGLPPYGKPAIAFPSGGSASHREGLVVRFGKGESAWIGNFQPCLSRFNAVETLPNNQHVLVVSGGAGYIVDPSTRFLVGEVGGAIVGLTRYEAANLLILNHQGISFEAIGESGPVWKTRRISWDGFRDPRIIAEQIVGEAWQPFSPQWVQFTVNIRTGEVQGGADVPANSG